MIKRFYALLLCLLLTGCAVPQQLQTPTTAPGTNPPATAQTTVTTFPSASIPQNTEVPVTVAPTQTTNPPTTAPTEATAIPTQPTTVPTQPIEPTAPPTQPTIPPVQTAENIKAMWLSQFDLTDVYFDGNHQRSKADFKEKASFIMEQIAAMGFNTVFLQIRPNADSMYPSDYYPMSKYVVGQYAGQAEYDPVSVLVELARQEGLSVHAWINPMRAMRETELSLLNAQSILGSWAADPDKLGKLLVLHNGTWYLNPAYPEVRQLIVNGAAEAMTRYDFDGLHMDDYFYPTTDAAFDCAAFEATDGTELADFRRQNLNKLVRQLYETAHAAGGVFSISPAGNIHTVYEKQYADVYTWCREEGYVDYICPQVYFGLEHENYDFVSVCRTFSEIIKTDSVKLLIGMTFGKALTREDPYAGSGKDEWKQHQDILMRCLQTTAQLPHCRGVAVFCYQYLYDPVTGKPVNETRREADNFLPVLQTIRWKSN